ncbi:MAG: DEAD/DEAH box helicase [Clostridia bacterium]|nr:DEAD/DEAH box helicase [Clostridia bacterium]
METINFNQLGLDQRILEAIDVMGFEEPSHIQKEVIPVLLDGYDAIGQAQTGTGKTLAFGAPILHHFRRDSDRKINSIILTPTRELAIQVNDELNRIGKYVKASILPIYGGQPIERQIKALKRGVDIVVGTPGRVLDLIRRKYINLSDIRFLVLDEADEMLDMGFIEDIELIIESCNDERQTMLFSATMPKEIKKLAGKYMKPEAKHVSIVKNKMTVSTVDQFYFEIKQKDRFETLCRILDVDNPSSVIIFCKTKKGVDELVEGMQSRSYNVEGMHGGMGQNQRLNTLRKFKEGNIEFLVATDVAARGIDIENISHVINYDLPQDMESYVHRIGRTGRAKKEGIAYTLVTPREYRTLKLIEKFTKCKIKRKEIPSIDDIFTARFRNMLRQVKETLEEEHYKKFIPLAADLDDEFNLVDVAAALMHMVYSKEISFDYDQSEMDTSQKYIRLFFTVGRMDQLMPKQLLQFLNKTANVNREDVGDIDILNKFTFVDVTEGAAEAILKGSKGKRSAGRKINVEISNKKRR